MKVARLLISVSCCYHKLTLVEAEKKTDEFNQTEYFNYFPLSTTLRNVFDVLNMDVGDVFRRPFMRLACQETSDRWLGMSEKSHNEHAFHVLARAVLELYGVESKY